jgi:hypothetical protein
MSKIVSFKHTRKPENGLYKFWIQMPSDFNRKEEIVVVKISYNFYYPELNEETKKYYIEIAPNKFTMNPGQSATTMHFRIFVYNYLSDKNSDVIVGDFNLYPSTFNFSQNSAYPKFQRIADFTQPWVKDLRVTAITGPYQEGKLVKEIDISKQVRYKAYVGGKKLAKAQLFAIKWSYSVDGGTKNRFLHHEEWIGDEHTHLVMSRNFPDEWNGKKVAVYAFFRGESEEVKANGTCYLPKPVVKEKTNEVNDTNEHLECCKVDEKVFFEEYDKQFTSSKLTDLNKKNITKIFKSINEFYTAEKTNCHLKRLSYILATVKHETDNTFDSIHEKGGNSYFEKMYDPILGKDENRRKLALLNGNKNQGDGVKYHGRGFSQLTWKNNYILMGKKFNVDLVNYPDKALDHELAMKILIYGSEYGKFTGVKLSDFINEKSVDYFNARKVINGTDKAELIKSYAIKIEKILKIKCNCAKNSNEFGLVQLTKQGNPYILNNDINEDRYIYKKQNGSKSSYEQHGDDWIKPEKALAFVAAVNKLVKDYPKQRIILNDCSAYNPSFNLDHDANGGHSRGDAFDCRFLTVNGVGSNDISTLTAEDIKINERFVILLRETGKFSVFYCHNGKIPGTKHESGHANHIHGE